MANAKDEPDWEEQHLLSKERMAQVDAMPEEVRKLIHEFNVNPVVMAYQSGYVTPEAIRTYLRAMNRTISPGAK